MRISDWSSDVCSSDLLVIKSILSPDDAREAVLRGADGIIVSNHGGRALDHAPATLFVLPEIVEAIGSKAVVMLDGGIRRGSDVIKAMDLGAKAGLIGRPDRKSTRLNSSH